MHNNHPGFDAMVFILPKLENGTLMEKVRDNLVVIVVECRFSDPESSTTGSVPVGVLAKYEKAKTTLQSDVSWVNMDRCVFRLCAYRDPSQPTLKTQNELKAVENVIICDKDALIKYMGPSLAAIINHAK